MAQRLGWYQLILPVGTPFGGPFWRLASNEAGVASIVNRTTCSNVIDQARAIRSGWLVFFSASNYFVGFPPAWNRDPVTGHEWPLEHWTKVLEFGAGDIKRIWEPSRFDALLVLAAAAVCEADSTERVQGFAAVNDWVSDWVAHNPANTGPNWRCAQETALRLINSLVADGLLRASGSVHTPELERFVVEHCARIEKTMLYAVAQDNNHATSEAAALYIAGVWLRHRSTDNAHRSLGGRWHDIGKEAFERGVRRLVMPDGTFAQYSVNYQRLFLDTSSLLELFRRHYGALQLAVDVRDRLASAVRWLFVLVDPSSGDAPNVGANDGARMLQLTGADYRDFRPTVQLAAALYCDACAFCESSGDAESDAADGSANDLLQWFDLSPPRATLSNSAPGSRVADAGGFAVMRRGEAIALLRYPRFRFRPSQADALHVDLWVGGSNLLRDAGTFAYNAEGTWLNYFGGAMGHNTVQFDDRDQMPRLGRFLLGDWLTTSIVYPLSEDAREIRFAAGYCDRYRASHKRGLHLRDYSLRVVDEVAGFARKAILRWRLTPGYWSLDGLRARNGLHEITVHSTTRVVRCEIVEGWESRYYGLRTSVPVMEIEVCAWGALTTEYRWGV